MSRPFNWTPKARRWGGVIIDGLCVVGCLVVLAGCQWMIDTLVK